MSVPTQIGVLKLLPPKLYNELKSSIDRTILALGRINAPPHNQRAAKIGVGIEYWLFFKTISHRGRRDGLLIDVHR